MGHHCGSPLGGRPSQRSGRPRAALGAGVQAKADAIGFLLGAVGQGLPSLREGACGGGDTSWIPLYKPPKAPLAHSSISHPLLSGLAPTFGAMPAI
jgi:hypothetical protein